MTARKRIAVVVQRAGEGMTGGSEGYALSMAEILAQAHDVDLLTTTARDYVTWKNELSPGETRLSDSLRIRRFPVDYERDDYWFELDRIVNRNLNVEKFALLPDDVRTSYVAQLRRRPLGLLEEWMKRQGPYSTPLLDYLQKNRTAYDRFFFMTYLYPTTYYGIDTPSDPSRVLLVSTFHAEPAAYLPLFGKYRRFFHVFLTQSERRLAEEEIYLDSVPHSVLGFGLEDRLGKENGAVEGPEQGRYLLYAGRLDPRKGVRQLFDMFERYRNASARNAGLRLVTIGQGELASWRQENVEYKGFVGEDEKLRLMENALALVHPSSVESLGIVLLESFMMATPVIANRRSEVLTEHVRSSRAGFVYANYDEFREALDTVSERGEGYATLSARAREYYVRGYSLPAYRDRLLALVEDA